MGPNDCAGLTHRMYLQVYGARSLQTKPKLIHADGCPAKFWLQTQSVDVSDPTFDCRCLGMFSIVTIPRRLKSARVLWPPAVSEEATSCDVWACDFGTEFSSSLQRVLERRQATTASSEIGRRSTERSASSSCPDLVQVEVYTQVPLTIKISSDRQSITTTSCVLRMPVWLLGHREVAIIVWEVLRMRACGNAPSPDRRRAGKQKPKLHMSSLQCLAMWPGSDRDTGIRVGIKTRFCEGAEDTLIVDHATASMTK